MTAGTPISLRGRLVWIGLIIFVSAWMFVLGILVGRGTVSVSLVNQSLENGLAELKAAIVKPTSELPGDPAAAETDIPVTELEFYEELKETKPKALIRPVPTLPALSENKSQAEFKTRVESTAVGTESADPIKPVSEKESPPTTETTIKAVHQPNAPDTTKADHFTIQVAAVQSEHNASKLVEQLRNKGFSAYHIQSSSQDGRMIFRVRVGAFDDRSAAETVLADLRKGNYPGFVLRTP